MSVVRRATKQRVAVSRVMNDLAEFRTAQQVHELLREREESVGLTTVYRTLQSMTEDGELDVVRTPDGETAYRRCRTDDHHHHLMCVSCGRAIEITDPDVHDWTENIARQHGFTDVRHDLEIYGRCPQCAAAPGTPA